MSSLLLNFVRTLQQILCAQQSKSQDAQGYKQNDTGEHSDPQHIPAHHQGAYPPHQGFPNQHISHTHAQHTNSLDHKPHHPYKNQDLINQENEHYKHLRTRATQEGEEMARCFEESHRAYEAGDGGLAKELSNKGHAHQKEMNVLNAQASDWIFKANNADSRPGEIDLHGLYVREAIIHTENAIQEAQSRGDSEIHLIVGKGLHSREHVSKLEPAIEELMHRYNLAAHLEEHNSGVLVVALDGRRNDRSLELREISRRLESKNEDCIVM